MDPSIFSKLELECGMEKEIKRLKNQIDLLEKENELLKQKEVERTKLNMEAECACIYSDGSSTRVYGESEQLDRLLANCSGLTCTKNTTDGGWGFTIYFVSIASAKTCLLRNGYKFSHESKPIFHTKDFYVENWFRGV